MEVTWLELVSKFSFLNKTSILQKTTNKFYAEKKEAELSSISRYKLYKNNYETKRKEAKLMRNLISV